MKNEKKITEEYQEFWAVATELTKKQCPTFLSDGKKETEKRDDTFWKHVIGMVELYHIRYGDPEERLRIVTFLESQLFRTPPIPDEVVCMTFAVWQDLKNTIMSGEYKVPSKSDKETG